MHAGKQVEPVFLQKHNLWPRWHAIDFQFQSDYAFFLWHRNMPHSFYYDEVKLRFCF